MATEQSEQSQPTVWRVAQLPHGRELVVRQSRLGDLPALQALYDGLDFESRYRRFFSVYHPPISFFERLVTVDGRGGAGIVACVRDGGCEADEVVGEANYELLENGDGEFALTIARGWRGWLGPYIFDTLLEVAASRGVLSLEAQILTTNAPMLAVVRRRDYVIFPSDDWTTLHVLVATGAGGPRWPARRAGVRLLIEGLGSHTAASVAAAAAGLEVVHCPGPVGRGRRCPVLDGGQCLLATGADAILVNEPDDGAGWDRIREFHERLAHRPAVWVASRRGRVPLRANESAFVADRSELERFFRNLTPAEQP